MGYIPPITDWSGYANLQAAPYQNTPNRPTMTSGTPNAAQSFMTGLPSSTYHNQQRLMGLNPSLPPFQPTGVDLQSNQPPPVPHSAMMDIQRRFVEMNVSHLGDVMTVSRRNEQIAQELESTKEACQSDLRYLERKVVDLQRKVDASSNSTVQTLWIENDCPPSREMLEQFSKERIAEAYLDHADDMCKVAEKMREQADQLQPGSSQRRIPTQKLLEASPESDGDEPPPSFACCGITFEHFDRLSKHIDSEHTKHDSVCGCSAPITSQDIASRPHAIETKAPTPSKPVQQPVAEDLDQLIPDTKWQPYAISSLPPMPGSIPDVHDMTFSRDFLRDFFGGNVWSPGIYYISGADCKLPSRAYWMLETKFEPFLPSAPGQHGAKLTAFFNETLVDEGMGPSEENYMNTPVFIREQGESGYRYFGQYSQLRYSDKLSYDELMEKVPDEVRSAVAEELAENGRPGWVTQALRKAMFPRPEYEGRVPTDSACNTPEPTEAASTSTSPALERGVRQDLDAYAEELKQWEKESTLKVKMLTKKDILDSFQREDINSPPGLRLWWEYLQCVGYDSGFFDMLVELSKMHPSTKSNKSNSIGRPPTPRQFDDASTDIKKGAAFLTKKGKLVRSSLDDELKQAVTPSAALRDAAESFPTPSQAQDSKPSPAMETVPPTGPTSARQRVTVKNPNDTTTPSTPGVARGSALPSTDTTRPATATFKLRKPAPVKKDDSWKGYEGMPPGVHTDNLEPTKWTKPSWASPPKQPAVPLDPNYIPPHIRKQKQNPSSSTGDKKKENPFSSTGDLKAAKDFLEKATPAQNKAKVKPPHLRGGGNN